MFHIDLSFFLNGADRYGDWFPSTGSNVLHRAQCVFEEMNSGERIEVIMLTKNREDTGNGTEIARVSFGPGDGNGTIRQDTANGTVKQLVRYRVQTDKRCQIRALPPTFFETAQIPEG